MFGVQIIAKSTGLHFLSFLSDTAQLNLPPVSQTRCLLKDNKAALSIQC